MLDMNIKYIGYLTHEPQEAFDAYIEKTGLIPTSMVIRPDFIVNSEHPLLNRSRHGAYGIILVTHESSDNLQEDYTIINYDILENVQDNQDDISDNIDNKEAIIEGKRSNTGSKPPVCPHCNQKLTVRRFNYLGYWHGWTQGKEPPYWNSLRNYIFKRDGYTCAKCKEVFKASDLVAHHIVPKEAGGIDGARNLITMCKTCHPDDKPIYKD